MRWLATALALGLYVARVGELAGPPPLPLVAAESMPWMLAGFGHAFRHIRRGSRWLTAASAAVLPVYILHEPLNITLVREVSEVLAAALLPLEPSDSASKAGGGDEEGGKGKRLRDLDRVSRGEIPDVHDMPIPMPSSVLSHAHAYAHV